MLPGDVSTDVADAYLIDPTVVDRVVVVSALGTSSATGGLMGNPNGYLDPWADTIVAARFRYVQISAGYDSAVDVPAARLPELPPNPFGSWVAMKQPHLYPGPTGSDQVSVIAVGVSSFVTTVERVSSSGPTVAGATNGPNLVRDSNGPAWLVTDSMNADATAQFQRLLFDPATYQRR